MENENKGLLGHRHRAQSIIQWKSLDQLEEEAVRGLYENIDYHRGSSYRIMLCEVVYGLLWWTSFQLISSCICHPDVLVPSSPPLLSAILISLILLSPSLLFKMAKFQAIASSPIVLLVVRLLSVLPIVVCQFPGPGNRLAAMCVGGVGSVLAIVGGWCNTSCIDRHRRVFYHFYGLVLYLSVKICSTSFNPLLTGTYIGTMATVTGIVLIIALSLLDKPTPILKLTDLAKMKIKMPRNYQLVDVDTRVWVWLGAGFGCQLFLTQLLFTDSNVLPRWCGITNTSLFSSLVVIALCVGLNSSIDRHLHLIISSQWLAIGTIALMVFYCATRVAYAFIACLLLTVHLGGVWLCMCAKLTRPMPILVGLMVYLLLMRVGVWGEILSCPLSQWLALPALVLQWTCLNKWVEFGIRTGRVKKSPKHSGKTEGSKKIVRKGSHIMVLGQIIRRLSTVSEFEEEEEEDSDGGEGDKERRNVHRERLKELLASELEETKYFNDKIITRASLVLCIVALLGSAYCYIPSPHSSHINKQVVDGVFNITTASFNGGYDSTGGHTYTHWKVLETINQSGSNIVCLHDISRQFLVSNIDLQDTIGRHIGMSVHLSQQRNPKVAVLTRYEVISSKLSEGVVLELKTADNAANPLTVNCHNTRPDNEFFNTNTSPLLVISKEAVAMQEKPTHDVCLNLFVYTKGLEQIKQRCNNEDGSSTISLRITNNG